MATASQCNRSWNGMVIPPPAITPCGHLTDTAEKFYVTACEEVDRLANEIVLNPTTAILDIGCGVGRLPIGLLARKVPFAFYLGVDVAKDRIDWCIANLSSQDPRLHFRFMDMSNARYNPNGRGSLDIALPLNSVDIVYLYSVFSHMLEHDVKAYVDLIANVLRPGGICFVTMFVADNVAPVSENPADFGPVEWVGPLHCVRYERRHWLRIVRAAGLKVLREVPLVNVDLQTGYFLALNRRTVFRLAGPAAFATRARSSLKRSLRWVMK